MCWTLVAGKMAGKLNMSWTCVFEKMAGKSNTRWTRVCGKMAEKPNMRWTLEFVEKWREKQTCAGHVFVEKTLEKLNIRTIRVCEKNAGKVEHAHVFVKKGGKSKYALDTCL